MTQTNDWGPIQRTPPRRYVAAVSWAVAQTTLAFSGMLLLYLTAMRSDACGPSCDDGLANLAINGLGVVLVVLLLTQIALLARALVTRASPHKIGALTVALSIASIGSAYLLVAFAYPGTG